MNVASPSDLSTVTVRAATADDAVADTMLASRRAFLPYAPSAHREPDFRDWVRDGLLGSPGAFVAVSGVEVIGVIATSSSDGASWIDQFYLRPDAVGRGVGARMLAVALADLPGPVRLWTFQQNAGSRRFYERHGFEPVRTTDGRDNEERCPDVLYQLSRDEEEVNYERVTRRSTLWQKSGGDDWVILYHQGTMVL